MKLVFRSYAREILKPHLIFLFIPLILSTFTHLWNPIGFPSIHGDEGHYIRRALILLGGGPPQEPEYNYDHPFFGQILLASMLGLMGYPNSLNLTSAADVHSIETIHLIPRLLMGVFAVLDTFLIYKIADYRYNRKVAFIAAILFAVMPSSWFIRRIFLDSLQLPFVLSSIFFALYYIKHKTKVVDNIIKNDTKNDYSHEDNNSYKHIAVLFLSGIFLGLAIFTKIPVFTMIPLVAYLIYKNGNNINKKGKLKGLGLWIIPVILIPAIWPAYAISVGEYDKWIEGLSSQSTRSDNGKLYIIDFNNNFLVKRLIDLYKIDPILVILGITGIAFAALRKDFFCLLWVMPILIFFYFLGFVRTFYLIPILPVFCIAGAIVLGNILEKVSTNRRRIKNPLYAAVTSAIIVFGLLSTTMLITKNVNSSYFELYSLIVQNLPAGKGSAGYYDTKAPNNSNKDKDKNMVSVVGNHWVISGFSWIPKYIYGKEHRFDDYFHSIDSQKVILVIDKRFMNTIMNITQPGKELDVDQKKLTELRNIYNKSDLVAKFNSNITERFNFKEYPYYSMHENNEMGQVDVRMNY